MLLENRKNIFLFAFLIVVLIGNAFFLNFNAFRILVFYDMAPYLDACWRLLNGQRMYVDFLFPEGPMHLDMMVVFFQMLGFGKAGILAHLIVVHSLVIGAVFLILYRKVPWPATVAVTLLTVPSFYWAFSHPWHDQSAYFWGMLALLVFLWKYPCRDRKKILLRNWACGVLVVLSAAAKTNIGFMFAVIFFLAVVAEDLDWKAAAVYLGGIATGLLISLGLIGAPAEFWEQNLLFAASKAGRIDGRIGDWRVWTSNYYWVPVLTVLVNTLSSFRKLRTLLILFYGVSLAAIGSIMTGGMRLPAHITLWGIQTALAFFVLAENRKYLNTETQKRIQRFTYFFLLAWALTLTVIAAQRGIGLKAWYRDPGIPDELYYRLKSKPLDGWMIQPWDGKILDRVVEIVKAQIPAEDSLLNLTDLYLVYALTGRDSFRGVNYAFWEDAFPASGKQVNQIKEHIMGNMPDWIIIRKNAFQFELDKLEMASDVVINYLPVHQVGDVLILKRKTKE